VIIVRVGPRVVLLGSLGPDAVLSNGLIAAAVDRATS
jgi:hypothetical protein